MEIEIQSVEESKRHPHILKIKYKILGETTTLFGSIRTTTVDEEEIKKRIRIDAIKILTKAFGQEYINSVKTSLVGLKFEL